MLSRAARLTWLVIGVLALALGALGIVLPLLPTTPLVLVAAFAFARSSERLHRWLLDHHIFGSLIDNWRRHGAISRRAKVVSVVSMILVLALSLVMSAPAAVVVIQFVALGAAACFVLSRPLPPGGVPGVRSSVVRSEVTQDARTSAGRFERARDGEPD